MPLFHFNCAFLILALCSSHTSSSSLYSLNFLKPPSNHSAHGSTIGTEEIRMAEQRLADLGYWTGPIDGILDERSQQALIAFRKIERLKLTGSLTLKELKALKGAHRPRPKFRGYTHVEIDLRRQVLFFVSESDEVTILPVSTGSGKIFSKGGPARRAVTPRGRFTVYRKIEGWRISPMGQMYFPNYIKGGVAIHGSRAVPTYPNSYGCISIPLFAAEEFSRMTPLGTTVIIYG